MSSENPFEKLLNIPNSPEVEQRIAEGFKERQEQRSYFYAQKAISQNNFDFYREYAI